MGRGAVKSVLEAVRDRLMLSLRARVPLIALVSSEERRVIQEVITPVAEALWHGRAAVWSVTEGYAPLPTSHTEPLLLAGPEALSALDAAAGCEDPTLFLMLDFHHHLERPAVIRRLRELAHSLPERGHAMLFLGPRFQPPGDLESEIEVVDIPPPDYGELSDLLGEMESDPEMTERIQLQPSDRSDLVRSMLGLTLREAETVLTKALVRDGAVTAAALDLVRGEKKQIIRRSSLIEFQEPEESLEQVGGLCDLKEWLRQRRAAFSQEAQTFGLPSPRGLLLLGVQGCGKSLVARAVSREWGLPLLRLDVGRLFGKFIGESEAAIRQVTRTAESVAPAILWIDEIEKGFAGASSESHDTGVSARVLGTFLTWLQEHQSPVFVVATANQIRHLPPELLRRGRFDELFFVDLPSAEDRREIFDVHLRRRRRDPRLFDLDQLAQLTEGHTGAEIEQVVAEGLYRAYAAGPRELTQTDLEAAVAVMVPLSRTLRESLQAMRLWADGRARRAG